MKRIACLVLLVLCIPSILCAQDKIDIPVWNVGDQWAYSDTSPYLNIQGAIEVVAVDQDTYTAEFSGDMCIAETQNFTTIIFEKSTLHRIYYLRNNVREEYERGRRKLFNFPLNPGKQWDDEYSGASLIRGVGSPVLDFFENYKVLGWEDVEVPAGKFKAIKLEITMGHGAKGNVSASNFTNIYWYSPDVKHFVKCQYDPNLRGISADIFNWELSSFKVKK